MSSSEQELLSINSINPSQCSWRGDDNASYNLHCIFCCKRVEEDDKMEESRILERSEEEEEIRKNRVEIVKRFFVFTERHLNFSAPKSAVDKNEMEMMESEKPACNDCFRILQVYCTLYHQMKCVELQLNWQLDKLWNVIKFADRVPSRVKSFREWCSKVTSTGGEGSESHRIESGETTFSSTKKFANPLKFRKNFKKQCRKYYSRRLPRICISTSPIDSFKKKAVIPGTQTDQSNVLPDNSFSCEPTDSHDLAQITQGEELDWNDIKEEEKDPNKFHYSLGWIASFVTIVFLYQPYYKTLTKDNTNENFTNTNEENCSPIPQEQSQQVFPIEAKNSENSGLNNALVEEMDLGGERVDASSIISEESNHNEDGDNEHDDNISDVNHSILESEKNDPMGRIENENQKENLTIFLEDDNLSKSVVLSMETESTMPFLASPQQEESTLPPLSPISTDNNAGSSKPAMLFPTASAQMSSVSPRRSLRQRFQCTVCKATFSSTKKLDAHMTMAHDDSTKMEISDDDDWDDDRSDISVNSETPVDADWTDQYIHPSNIGNTNSKQPLQEIAAVLEGNSESQNEDTALKEKPEMKKRPKVASRSKCTQCDRIVLASKSSRHRHNVYFHSNGRVKLSISDSKIFRLETFILENLSLKNKQNICLVKNCGKGFPLIEELQQHTRLYHKADDNGTIFTCNFCDNTATCPMGLIDHELEHLTPKLQLETKGDDTLEQPSNFGCGRCNFQTEKKINIVIHYLHAHLNMPPIQATCPICKQTFYKRHQVPIGHYVNYHDLRRLDDPTKPFRCAAPECSAYFLTEDQLHVHWNNLHKRGSASTPNSNHESKQQRKKRWTRENPTKRKLKCLQCPKSFIYPQQLRSHVLLEHNLGGRYSGNKGALIISTAEQGLTIDDLVYDRKAKYFCNVEDCKKGFLMQEDFKNHSQLHGEFKCSFCEVTKTFAIDLSIHETLHAVQVKTEKTKSYCCPRCPFSASRKHKYLEHHVGKHLNLMLDNKKCPICRHVYVGTHRNHIYEDNKLKLTMMKHYADCHDIHGCDVSAVHYCDRDECPAFFRTPIQLQMHISEIHEKRLSTLELYTCQDCGRQFARAMFLRFHRKNVHKITGEKLEFPCTVPECDKRFETKLHLENHVFTYHTSSKGKIECPEKCGQFFWSAVALHSHLRGKEHRGLNFVPKKVEPLVCAECGKSFTAKERFKVHMLFHAGPDSWEFSCSVCNKKIATKQKLDEHMRTHTKVFPFICQVCGVAYRHRHNLRIHVNNKHGLQDPAKPRNIVHRESSRKGKKYK